MRRDSLTADRLRELVEYDSLTGTFSRRARELQATRLGRPYVRRRAARPLPGHIRPDGYVEILVDGSIYLAHRLAWLYMTGVFPSEYIDHKNRGRADNTFSNLREATPTENQGNRKRGSNNRCGLKGVSYHKYCTRKPWQATIMRSGKRHSLGYHATPEEAHAAYVKGAIALFGEFARAA